MSRYPEDLVIAVAHFYYIEGFTQEEVAYRLNTSRVMVTRMLKRARELGLVQINIKKPLPAHYRLSLSLESKFGLRLARVVKTGASEDETLEATGREGAELLESLIQPHCRIGVAWSKTVCSILPYVKKPHKKECIVNELAGTYLSPEIPYSVSWQLAEKLKAPIDSIPVPVLVQSEDAKEVMLKEEMIRNALDKAKTVNFAFVGLGEISEKSSLSRSGYITEEFIREIENKGAVGEILMRYYNAEGEYIHTSFESRTISLEWNSIRALPLIIGMAYGENKIPAITGAIRGGLIHGLITDRKTAEALLSDDNVPGNGHGRNPLVEAGN